MELPQDLKYTKEHEWIKFEGGSGLVGITEFAQNELGELVFVELPAIGKDVVKSGTLCVVESTKAASDVYSPVSGKIKEVNSELSKAPDLVNKDPYGKGWLVQLSNINDADLDNLMDSEEYRAYLGNKA